tara:strand:- start:58815 stop:59483 length:669 start_codon:yes stop_codon:yes gene_type:complete
MKYLLLVALFAIGASANDYVVLEGNSVRLESSTASLEKTAYTPNSINLIVPVTYTREMCEPRDERRERYDCSETDTYYDPYCYGGPIGYPRHPRGGGVVVRGPRYNPPGGTVGRSRTTGRVVVRTGRSHRVDTGCWRTRRIPRTCTRTICTNPYYVDDVVSKNFTLTFDNYNRNDVLNFSLDQYGNLTLMPTRISAGCTVLTKYGSGSDVTGAKLKLKRSCR